MPEAGRTAELYPGTPVFVLSSGGEGGTGAAFGPLRPFQRAFVVDGGAPEDSWTRIARHWHECFRLSHPAVPGRAKEPARRPWADLDEFFRADSTLQLGSIMAAVAARGRRWVPSRAVVPGTFIELSDGDLEDVAGQEHARWQERRRKAGWRPAAAGEQDDDNAKINRHLRPWADLPGDRRDEEREYVRYLLEQLEAVGFMPILPDGGPADAADFQRIGEVRATQLIASHAWWTPAGDELAGTAGDWRVADASGDERTVRDPQFQATHELLDGDRWRRTGTVRAWQVSEAVVVRTMEGRAVAHPGDWIVQGPQSVRRPVGAEHFARGYRRIPPAGVREAGRG